MSDDPPGSIDVASPTRTGSPSSVPWISVASVVVALLVWEGVCRAELVSRVLLVAPSRIAVAGVEMLGLASVRADIGHTLAAFAASLAIALVGGAGVGLLIGWSPVARQVLQPFVVTFHALPKVVLMPLILLWVGFGLGASVFLGAMMAAFPVLTSVAAGVGALEADLLVLARAFGAPRRLTVRAIVLPGLAPFLVSGLRVGISYAMVGVLIAELAGSGRGVGHLMLLFLETFEIERLFAAMTLVAGLTLAATGAVGVLERRLGRWRPDPA